MAAALPGIAWTLLLSQAILVQPSKVSPGLSLWQQAQDSLRRGQTDRAIELFEESLAADPTLTRCYLGLAAAWLDRCEEARACECLTLYVAAHPEHLRVRSQFADLLYRLRRTTEARREYELFIADAQDRPDTDEQLIHCHSRLMQIAEEEVLEYDEHLHRGIGLYLLAMQDHGGPATGADGQGSTSLLCKAAAELTIARHSRPDEARPCWYLHEIWTRLA